MSGLAGARSRPTAFFGRHVVAAAFVLAVFGWGAGFYGPPVYLEAVIARTGWPLAFVSATVTVHFLFGALVISRLPGLYRRFGLPAVTNLGAVCLALGVLGWALAAQPWQLVLAALMSGAGWVTMGAAALNAIVSPWFVRARPAALSTAYNGASIGGVILAPLWATLISSVGFPVAAAAVGTVTVCVVTGLTVLVFSKTPAGLGQAPDGDPRESARPAAAPAARPPSGLPLWRNRAFVTLAGGMALGLFAQTGLITHLFSVLVPSVGERTAGFVMALATACAIAGRFAVGWAMPAGTDRRIVVCLCYAVQLLGSLVLLAACGRNHALLIPGIILFGAGIGNATSLPPLVAQAEFLPEDVQRVVSSVVATAQALYAFAPAGFGLLRASAERALGAQAGSAALFAATAAFQALAIACFLAGRSGRNEMAHPPL